MPQATVGGSDSVRRLIAFAFLLTAILYLLFFHGTSEVMSRSGREPWTEFVSFAQELQTAAQSGQNAEFHFGDVPDYASTEAVSFARGYFLACYLEYPKRVFVGSNQQVINSPDQLLGADICHRFTGCTPIRCRQCTYIMAGR